MRLETNYREKKKKTIKNTNTWRLNNMLPSGSLKKSNRKSKNTETNDNENVMIQNLWDRTKAVLQGKLTVI